MTFKPPDAASSYGAGAALALPWLESLPGLRGRRVEPRPTRAFFVFAPNGKVMPDWTPAADGEAFDACPSSSSRSPRIAGSSWCSRDSRWKPRSRWGTDPATMLAGRRRSSRARTRSRPAAQHPRGDLGGPGDRGMERVRDAVPEPRARLRRRAAARRLRLGLQLRVRGQHLVADAHRPGHEGDEPQAAFRRLFAGPDDGLRPEEAAARRRERASILDVVLDDAKALSARLGTDDRRKLDDYMTSVREVEARIRSVSSAGAAPDRLPAAVPGADDYAESVRLMYDLVALAFRADLTRVATLMLGNAGSSRSYRVIDVPEGHHHLSHHGGDAEKLAKLRKINRFHTEQFARFVGTLAATRDADGTLLDRTIAMYGCAIADGDRHDHVDLPIVVAGGGNGTLPSGRHLRYPKNTPLANLYLSILDRMNVRATSFGDSTGRLAGM